MTRYWPLERGHMVTSGFGARWGTAHWGCDFGREGGSGGMAVHAVQGGSVTHVGPASGFGQWVVLDHPTEDGSGTTVYGHIIPEVHLGQRVEAGQRIAHINPDSNTNGGVAPHLHLEWHRYVWSPPGPNRLDPLPLLDGALFPGEAPPSTPAGGGMDAQALSEAMGGSLPIERYRELLPGFMNAMLAAKCTTVERAAMWCAQIGHESAGLQYMEEIASGAAYNGRADLGNTQPGDGPRFKGSGPIQLTGRANFRAFSAWCHAQGWVDSPTYFEQRPQLVRDDPHWGFLAASWYWTVARPQINSLADTRNLEGVTRAINGGLNGIADRSTRYQRCLNLGTRLLPTSGGFLDMLNHEEQVELLAKTRDLWNLGVRPVPSLVDKKPFSPFSLIPTADKHAFDASVKAEEILEVLGNINRRLEALEARK
ncbi:peptidoglycan DD-metalloendopeptidase family protein [Rhodococcus sp. Chr-9]|uniref:peptidoglycan DD-metalloendopeptidase family protein n=1 Tax=Rhodococcus sp. Chr-9 TaxID=713612 RepID=UPI001F215C2C|nr:peptidoglycan DD-metalloendopeptidase family protein [Rhodococcus sp. Chr-9]